MLAAIDGAGESIHLSTYIFDGDEAGGRFVAALRRAAARGVAVRVIIDALGEKYSRPTARSLLKGSGVEIGRFLPLRQGIYINLRNHRKILVVDGRTGFMGGMNIGDRHMVERQSGPPPVRDFSKTGFSLPEKSGTTTHSSPVCRRRAPPCQESLPMARTRSSARCTALSWGHWHVPVRG